MTVQGPQPGTSKAPCSWCYNGHRKTWVPAGHVALFACIREHMVARALCESCATQLARVGDPYICRDCEDAGVIEDDAFCLLTLITTRAEWMDQINAGRIRMLVPQ